MQNKRISLILAKITRGQKGLTLIELMTVLSILAILVTIVTTAVSGTGEDARDQTAKQDASSAASPLADYFKDQAGAAVITQHTVLVTAKFNAETTTPASSAQNTLQKTSSRWAEAFISKETTFTGSSVYTTEFPASGTSTDGKVVKVSITDKGTFSTDPVVISRLVVMVLLL